MATTETKKISSVKPMANLTMGERLKVVRQARGLTQQQLADLLKISRPTVAQLEGERHQPSNDVLETIVRELVVSRNWLWFGTGPMEEQSAAGGDVNVIRDLEGAPYADIPLVGIKVRGSFLDLMDDGGGLVQFQSLDVARIYDPTPEMLKSGTLGFEINGDSMEPQLRTGMKVVGTWVDLANVKYMTSGVYVVAFSNQLTIKRVKNNEILEKGFLTLHADNPNAGSLPVAASDIRYVWKVVRIFYADVI